MSVEVDELPAHRLPEQVELAAYFVVSEALTQRRLPRLGDAGLGDDDQDYGRVGVEISDDGVGGADVELGTGLCGLTDRLAAIEGQLEVDSQRKRGTTVRASIPCP